MRQIAILLCGLLLVAGVSVETKAEPTEFWVVGSFKSLPGAITEKRRIEGRSGLAVRVGTFNRTNVPSWRLLIEKDRAPQRQRQKIIDAGITPWTLKINASSLDWSADDASEYDWARYLVLAGFRSEARAYEFVESLRGQGLSDLGIDEIGMAGRPYFRVLYGPFDMQDREVLEEVKAMGLTDSWWVIKDSGNRKSQAVASTSEDELPESGTTTPMPDETPRQSQPRQSPSRMAVNPPRAGESWMDYCVNRANSAERRQFCKDGGFMSTAVKAEQARRGQLSDEEYFLFCTSEATADQRDEHCTDAQLVKKLRRLGEAR